MSDALRRRTLRVAFSVRGPMASLHPPALLASLASVFERAGVRVALGAEKRPRPMARLAYPLPPGAEGMEEWAEVTLEEGLAEPAEAAAARLRAHCPEGLDILRVEQVPRHASPIDELVAAAHWAWPCPEGMLAEATEKIGAFLASPSFILTKTGKQGGVKGEKPRDVRPLALGMEWDGGTLLFRTAVVQGHALNPQKLLAAVLGDGDWGTGAVRRLRLDLGDDPRLARHDKYAHKLRNLYEDAVLLESGPGPGAPDDDDEVIRI